MNVLVSVNTSYLDKAETMLHSLRRNHSEEITVYLLNRSLNSAEVARFRRYLNRNLRMGLEVVDMPRTEFDQLSMGNERFSVEVFYRVLAQFLLPETVDRILWLDADIVVCGNVSGFYYQDFGEKLLAVCPDAVYYGEEIAQIKADLGLSEEHVYFNSGVLLLNVEALRKKTDLNDIVQTAQSIAKYFTYPDQDLLNYLYTGQVKYCDQIKYNCQVKSFKELTKEQINEIAIFHYAGSEKPWTLYQIHSLSKAAIPYWKEVALQGKWLSVAVISVLYFLWMVYYKTGICHIVRKGMLKADESRNRYNNRIG